MPTPCFLITRTDTARYMLRRYNGESVCPVHTYHNAVALTEVGPLHLTENGYTDSLTNPPQDDPRWPTTCDCGYVFCPEDHWQHYQDPLYAGPDGQTYSIRHGDAPVGAMWHADWLPESWRGPDGLSLVLRLPDGRDWNIDGRSQNGPGWQRTGEPPLLTVRPSILTPEYHGWLTNGVLSDHIG